MQVSVLEVCILLAHAVEFRSITSDLPWNLQVARFKVGTTEGVDAGGNSRISSMS